MKPFVPPYKLKTNKTNINTNGKMKQQTPPNYAVPEHSKEPTLGKFMKPFVPPYKLKTNKTNSNTNGKMKQQTPPNYAVPEHSKELTLGKFLKASPSVARAAGEAAQLYSQDFEMHSKLANRAREKKLRQRVTQLRWSDLQIGELLGRGNFSHVYEVKLLRRRIEEEHDEETVLDQNTISTDAWDVVSCVTQMENFDHHKVSDIWDLVSHSGTIVEEPEEEIVQDMHKSYALKHLHPGVMANEKEFKASAIDLVLEAKLLGNLCHDNIIHLHAVTAGSISTVFSGGGFFLLLDKLTSTLEDKINDWAQVEDKKTTRKASKFRTNFLRTHKSEIKREEQSVLEDRIRNTALGIARGMEYLHSNRIIFRDLKPANVGYDAKGNVKIFDFGLAREVVDSEQRLTGNTGSLRYMAPEVAQHAHYGLKADIYSFGLLLWEVLSCELPYEGLTRAEHSSQVVYGGSRPDIEKLKGSEELKQLIESCWHSTPQSRPNFIGVRHTLLTELAQSRRLETEKWVKDVKGSTDKWVADARKTKGSKASRNKLRRKNHKDEKGDKGNYHIFENGKTEVYNVGWS